MKIIYLTGHNTFNNKGCEAIVRSTIKLLKKNDESLIFIVPSKNIKRDMNQWPEAEKNGVRFIKYQIPLFLRIIWKIQKILNLCNYDIFNYYPKSLLKEYQKVDLFLSVGGDNYSFDYTYPFHIIYQDKLAFKLNKPVVLWGASVGKFDKKPFLIPKLQNHLSRMNTIYVREKISYKYLKEILNLDNIKITCDPAFALDIEKNNTIDNLINTINKNNQCIGINLSNLIFKFINRDIDISMEIKKLVYEINQIFNMHVILIPHVWENQGYDAKDDYQLLKEIFNECVKDNLNISLAPKNLNALQIKYLISKCKIFIGARTHSLIAALSLNIPAISLSYSIKSEGINEMIFGNKKLVINCNKIENYLLIEKIKEIVNKQNYYEKILKIKNRSFKKILLKTSFDLYDNFL